MQEDSDELRTLIEARMREKGLSETNVSRRIGRKRTYLNDYFRKRSPKFMPLHIKVLLAKELDWPASRLGVPSGLAAAGGEGGFSDDAVPYRPGPHFPQLPDGFYAYLVNSDALSQFSAPGIPAGTLIPGVVAVIDGRVVDHANVAPGNAVLGQMMERDMPQRHLATVFRQFIAPDKLITNRRGDNEILTIDDPDANYLVGISGVLSYVLLHAAVPLAAQTSAPLKGNVPLILPGR